LRAKRFAKRTQWKRVTGETPDHEGIGEYNARAARRILRDVALWLLRALSAVTESWRIPKVLAKWRPGWMTKPHWKDLCTRGEAAVGAGELPQGGTTVLHRGRGAPFAPQGRARLAARAHRRVTAASRVNASQRQNRRPKRSHEARQGLGAGHATQCGLKIHLQTRAPALSEISSRILG
jgi:hypothetical protein